ncbi:MAG: oligosaccharide flippase family protein [Solirubrobacterales bacterium]
MSRGLGRGRYRRGAAGAGAGPGSAATEPAEGGTIGRGSALLFGAQLVGNAGFFFAVLIIARSLGPSGRGAIAFITVTALVVARVMKVGISQATTVFAAQRPHERAVLLSNLIIFSIAGSLAGAGLLCGVLLAAPGIRPGDIGATELWILLAGTVATSLWDESFLLGCNRMRALAGLIAIAGWMYVLVLGLAWATVGLDVSTVAGAWAVSQALAGLMFQAGPLWSLGLALPSLRLLREMLRFGTRAWVGTLSALLNARFDQILMAFITTQATLGIYAVAANSSELLLYVPAAIATAMLPAIAGNNTLTAERALRLFRAASVIGIGAALVAAAAGPVLVPLVFGEPFRASVAPFLWLLPGVVGYTAMSITNSALLASGAPGRSSLGPLACLVAGVALDLVLIPAFGASGAAAAATAGFTIGGITGVLLYRHQVSFGWSELVPRPGDAGAVWAFASGLVRRRSSA